MTVLGQKLAELGFRTYRDYLLAEHWEDFRHAFYVVQVKRLFCACCGRGPSKRCHLNLHHNNYARLGREAWADITVLCETCHENVHKVLTKHGKDVTDTDWAIHELVLEFRATRQADGVKRLAQKSKKHEDVPMTPEEQAQADEEFILD